MVNYIFVRSQLDLYIIVVHTLTLQRKLFHAKVNFASTFE